MAAEDKVAVTITFEGKEYSFGFNIEDYKRKRRILLTLERVLESQLDCLILGITPDELREVQWKDRPGVEPLSWRFRRATRR